ncbi:hypothetical protein PENTCL1PPCAC_8166, partial [Pristionchus entomophagus]
LWKLMRLEAQCEWNSHALLKRSKLCAPARPSSLPFSVGASILPVPPWTVSGQYLEPSTRISMFPPLLTINRRHST